MNVAYQRERTINVRCSWSALRLANTPDEGDPLVSLNLTDFSSATCYDAKKTDMAPGADWATSSSVTKVNMSALKGDNSRVSWGSALQCHGNDRSFSVSLAGTPFELQSYRPPAESKVGGWGASRTVTCTMNQTRCVGTCRGSCGICRIETASGKEVALVIPTANRAKFDRGIRAQKLMHPELWRCDVRAGVSSQILSHAGYNKMPDKYKHVDTILYGTNDRYKTNNQDEYTHRIRMVCGEPGHAACAPGSYQIGTLGREAWGRSGAAYWTQTKLR